MARQPSSLLNRKLSRTHRCRAMFENEGPKKSTDISSEVRETRFKEKMA